MKEEKESAIRRKNIWRWFPACLLSAILLALAASGIITAGGGAKRDMTPEDFISHLEKRTQRLMEIYDIPGCSLSLVKDGKILWGGAYGYADIKTGRLLKPDTPMRVQSISKPVTAWGVLRLAEQGSLNLEAPISSLLRQWRLPPSPVSTGDLTCMELLSHRSGLPLGDVFTIYRPGTPMPSLEERLTEEVYLQKGAGGGFSYSNTGFNLLELIIEENSGEDFASYMEREILMPLGMGSASFNYDPDSPPPVGYDLSGQPVPFYLYPEKGSGGLLATAEDIAAFACAGMPDFAADAPVLQPQTILQLYEAKSADIGVYNFVFDGYGLGYYTEKLPNGALAVAHGGQGSGIMTHFHAAPETGDAIVILTNSQRSWPFIAYLLEDWTRWRDFPSVGMGRILLARYALWAMIALVWSLLLFSLLRIAVNRREREEQKPSLPLRFGKIGLALALAATVLWCAGQRYLFLSSVFPLTSFWLAVTALFTAGVLLLSALPPKARAARCHREEP